MTYEIMINEEQRAIIEAALLHYNASGKLNISDLGEATLLWSLFHTLPLEEEKCKEEGLTGPIVHGFCL